MRKTLWFIICYCALSIHCHAQDPTHYTLHRLAPTTINPGFIGGFEGTFRIGGVFRGQLYDVDGYTQPVLYVDAPIIRGIREQDWIGIGLSMNILENAGESNLQLGGQSIGASYHFSLDEDQTSVIALGVEFGGQSTSARFTEGNFNPRSRIIDGDNWSILDFNQYVRDNNQGEYQYENKKSGLNLGLTYSSLLSKTSSIKAGVTFANLSIGGGFTASDTAAVRNNNVPKETRLGIYTEYTQYINEKLRIVPSLYAQFMGGARTTQVQFMGGYLLDPKKNTVINAGLGLRAESTAVEFLFGIEQGPLNAGLSFDLPMSGTAGATGIQNAFELGISYIIKINKKPDVKPVIFCPRL